MAQLGKLVLLLALGCAGGSLLAWLGAPAPWLTGSMLVIALAAAKGLPVKVPHWLRTLAFVLVGTSIGSAVTPDALVQIREWPVSFLVLVVAIIAMMSASATLLSRMRGWEQATARFSSIPGTLSQVLVLAMRSKADLPRIVLAQSLRLVVLIALLPWLVPEGHFVADASAVSVQLSVPAAFMLVTVGGAVGLLLEYLKVPGGILLGAMMVSAVLHGMGIVTGRVPVPLMIFGFVVTGCVVGGRFAGTSWDLLHRTLRGALESILLALVISALLAWLTHWWLGFPFGQVWLAYAPGGVEAMTIMAFALGFDPAFVGAHHVVRLIVLNIVVPFWVSRTDRLMR